MQETPQLAQCMVEVRKLVRRVLTEGNAAVHRLADAGQLGRWRHLLSAQSGWPWGDDVCFNGLCFILHD